MMSSRLAEADRLVWKPPADAFDRLKSLTPQYKIVLHLLTSGLGNKQIAYCLDIAEAMVKAHVSTIYERIGAYNRVQAVLFWLHAGGAPDTVAVRGVSLPRDRLATAARLPKPSYGALAVTASSQACPGGILPKR